jgi:hypothetical protein
MSPGCGEGCEPDGVTGQDASGVEDSAEVVGLGFKLFISRTEGK